MKKILLFSVLLAAVSASVYAQSANAVTALLEQKRASISDVAYFSASSLGLVTDDATGEKSLELLAQADIFKTKKEAAKPVTYGDLAFLCATTWGISGGIWYTKYPSPRYAFRELKARGIIPITADPSLYVSGREALRIITKCAEIEPENNPVRVKVQKFLAGPAEETDKAAESDAKNDSEKAAAPEEEKKEPVKMTAAEKKAALKAAKENKNQEAAK